MISLEAHLKRTSYPGRGIMLGRTPDGKNAVAAYFIMGRSVNSRNRIFAEEPDGIRTEAFDPTKMEDPSLIIYHPVRELNGHLIVTNGDQTDTIRDFMAKGQSMVEALLTREFEPDRPNWTPRVSGVVAPDGSYQLSILKSADAEGTGCVRETFAYPGQAGIGHLIHTYNGDGNPLPSFTGEPHEVAVDNDIYAMTDLLWKSLNDDNKVSLFVRYTNLEDGTHTQCIINKNK